MIDPTIEALKTAQTRGPEPFETLPALLEWRAIHQPERTAYVFLDDNGNKNPITYAVLYEKACKIAGFLVEHRMTGRQVVLLYHSGLDFVITFLGCMIAGTVSVPLSPPASDRTLSRLHSVIQDADAQMILTTYDILSQLRKLKMLHGLMKVPLMNSLGKLFLSKVGLSKTLDYGNIPIVGTDELDLDSYPLKQKPVLGKHSLAFLQYTSGSTSTPKGVMVSHNNLMYNCNYMKHAYPLSEKTISVSWLPVFHDMGLIEGILNPLYTGYPAYLMSMYAFIKNPFLWLESISKYKATHSGAPNFAYELCSKRITDEQLATLDLSSWVSAYNGAEPVRESTLRHFTERFAKASFKPEYHYPCYGLAEGTLMVTGGEGSALPVIRKYDKNADGSDRYLVGCGTPRMETVVKIVNPDTKIECGGGETGEIWVSGPTVALGYWQKPKTTREKFNAYIANTGEGPFLRTGDLGFLDENGELFINGRLKDVMIISGKNYYPQDVELTTEDAHPYCRKGCSAAFSVDVEGTERLVVVVETKPFDETITADALAQKLRQDIFAVHNLSVEGIVFIKPKSIPKTASGKIQRSATKAGFLDKSLDAIHMWLSPQIKTLLN